MERWQRLKEIPSNLFWKIVLPFFRLKWWFNGREARKKFRERETWEFMLHGYKTCIHLQNGSWLDDDPCFYCARPLSHVRLRRIFWIDTSRLCKKSKKCKHYMYDPIKG